MKNFYTNLFTVLMLLMALNGVSQEIPISNSTITTCQGAIEDTGISHSDYQGNEDFTMTIYSDGGPALNLYFVVFDLGAGDQLIIYDGEDVSAPVLGTYTGQDILGYNVTSTNPQMALTLHFTSDATDHGNFGAVISCDIPCASPIVSINDGGENPLKVCQGEPFDLTASYFSPDGYDMASFEWTLSNGITSSDPADYPTFNVSIAEQGSYVAELRVVDSNGCESINVTRYYINVSTSPTIEITGETTSCLGEEVTLSATVTPDPIDGLVSGITGALFIPDGAGVCFSDTIRVIAGGQFATIETVSDIENIFMNFEHSYMGDLVITLIAPNGSSVTLHQQGGGGTYLGVPVDDDAILTPGTGFDYTWSPSAVNGNWAANAGGTLASGDYESFETFDGLIGSSVNGNWIIEICDMWSSDNGFIFDWNVNFAPEKLDPNFGFTPIFGQDCLSTFWDIPLGLDVISFSEDCNSVVVAPQTNGIYNYTYSTTDDFGCTYTGVHVLEVTGDIAPDAGENQEINASNGLTLTGNQAGTWSQISGPNTSDITSPNLATTTVTDLAVGIYVFELLSDNCGASQVEITVLQDTDSDGIVDQEDLDDDNDGIADADEDDNLDNDNDPETNPTDRDGDGIPNYLDHDSDNDGIADIIEAGGIDLNGDGTVDYPTVNDPTSMIDEDNDGLMDAIDNIDNGSGIGEVFSGIALENPDSDNDLVKDVFDLDSDNDGITDISEAGGIDSNNDGQVDYVTIGDPTSMLDGDSDGFASILDSSDGGTNLPNKDIDNDGILNVHDHDSDNDGISDIIEAGGVDPDGDGSVETNIDGTLISDVDQDGITDEFVVDTDGDGMADQAIDIDVVGADAMPNPDTDLDGIKNIYDLDSDNDGISDLVETNGTDEDGDSMVDFATPGVATSIEDIDNDGFADSSDDNPNFISWTAIDFDMDGLLNYVDIDSDNDGVIDNVESQSTASYEAPTGIDSDNDGIDNAYDNDNSLTVGLEDGLGSIIELVNTDSDILWDFLDNDSDNDGESDLVEGHDTNGDGTPETTPLFSDEDEDGLDDGFDQMVLDGTNGQNGDNASNGTNPNDYPDVDLPSIGDRDWRENDTDGDGINIVEDIDDDNDGIPDYIEICGLNATGFDCTTDPALDDDEDGISNYLDADYINLDTDNDYIIDIFDLDSDNDGISDIIESGGTDTDENGRVDDLLPNGTLSADIDSNGWTDTNGITEPLNFDTDNKLDFQDLDSDNDGMPDVVEDGGSDMNTDGKVDDFTDLDGNGWDDNNPSDGKEDTDDDGFI